VSGGDIVIRAATADDAARIADIMYGDPGPELIGLVGDRTVAAAFGKGLVALERLPNDKRPTVVAERDGTVVGVLQYTVERNDERDGLATARLALRVGGPLRVLRAIPRMRARQRIDIGAPVDAFYIAEIHVDPSSRGQGIGGQLLAWADGEARRIGRLHMALVTHLHNPARRLYERHGYAVTRSRSDAKYERYTGTPGRVLMEKTLSAS
jgi:ribosomal protein S18 acetylase RimI-like enzyme